MEATKVENQYFYPRSPCGERPILGIPNQVGTWISIHALLAESDDKDGAEGALDIGNFYPRSPCGERPRSAAKKLLADCISIHALLAESDSKSAQNSGALLRI